MAQLWFPGEKKLGKRYKDDEFLIQLLVILNLSGELRSATFENDQTTKQDYHQEYYCFLVEQFSFDQ